MQNQQQQEKEQINLPGHYFFWSQLPDEMRDTMDQINNDCPQNCNFLMYYGVQSIEKYNIASWDWKKTRRIDCFKIRWADGGFTCLIPTLNGKIDQMYNINEELETKLVDKHGEEYMMEKHDKMQSLSHLQIPARRKLYKILTQIYE